jgi:hypothetical protein
MKEVVDAYPAQCAPAAAAGKRTSSSKWPFVIRLIANEQVQGGEGLGAEEGD